MCGIFPKCRHRKKDCFALMKDGSCFCLNETLFIDDGEVVECPFYVNKDVADMERRSVDDPSTYEWMKDNGYYLKGSEQYEE